MKKLLLLPFVFVLLAVGIIGWFYINVQPVSGNKDFKNFLIPKGSSAGQIGRKLQEAGLVRSAIAFKIYTQFTGVSDKIVAGEYRLMPSFSLFQIVDQLTKGPLELWVTIPEGLRREEIATKFTKGLDKDDSFYNEFLALSASSEGMLFPDTYLFPKEATAPAIIKKLRATFESKTASLNLTREQIILASLVERETKTADERPVVSGILVKRLNAGWPLQVDASVQYAVGTPGNWWPILIKADVSINSPYNSYKFSGLPSTPIANPGISSLKAAANPEESDYWYYIHDKDGVIHFAKTLEEHNANINRYLTK